MNCCGRLEPVDERLSSSSVDERLSSSSYDRMDTEEMLLSLK
jgi:hypothetical protein